MPTAIPRTNFAAGEKEDFKPRPDEIFQERLYCIQWIECDTLGSYRPTTFFAAVTEEDLGRERKIETIIAKHLAQWQEVGLVPDMAIEPGDKTDEPIRTRGWMYWHQLFTPRNILTAVTIKKRLTNYSAISFCDLLSNELKISGTFPIMRA